MLKRTALRLSALAALTNAGGGAGSEPDWPTMANDNVYDSRQDPIESITPKERRPVIVIRTDEDSRNYSTGNGGRRLTGRTISLLVEISVVTSLHDEEGALVLGWPESDAELEAVLDLMEFQVENALWGNSDWATWFSDTWIRTDTISDQLYTEPDQGGVRLAARVIRLTIVSGSDCLPPPKRYDEDVVPGALPDYLDAVFDKIAVDGVGDFKDSAARLRTVLESQKLPESFHYPQLQRVRMKWYEPVGNTPTGEEPHLDLEAELLADPADYIP